MSDQSRCSWRTPDSIAEKTQQVVHEPAEPGRLGRDAGQEPLLGFLVPGHVGLQQAGGVAPDRGERGAELVTEPGQEAALQFAGAAQRSGLLVGEPGFFPLQRQPAASGPRPPAGPRSPRAAARHASGRPARPGRPVRGRPPTAAGSSLVAAGLRGHVRALPGPRADPCGLQDGRARRAAVPAGWPHARSVVVADRRRGPSDDRYQRHLVGLQARGGATGGRCPARRRLGRAGQRLQHLPDRLQHPVAGSDLVQQPVPLDSLAAYPAYRVARSRSSRCGLPAVARNTVMTPRIPPGPRTGTDQELATLADLASLGEGRPGRSCLHVLLDNGALRGRGQPDRTAGRAQRQLGPGGQQRRRAGPARPRTPAGTPPSRWMHSRSLPSAAPSADRIRDRLDDGSADTSRSVRPCSRVSCRRAEASTSWPGHQGHDVDRGAPRSAPPRR